MMGLGKCQNFFYISVCLISIAGELSQRETNIRNSVLTEINPAFFKRVDNNQSWASPQVCQQIHKSAIAD